MQNLKQKVKGFLEFDFEEESQGGGNYGSLPKAMFKSDYPKKDSKWNGDFESAVLAKADELCLTVDFVDNFGGEGQGNDYWSVYSFTDGDEVVYVQFDGWYASYEGSEYTEWFFVEPKQVTVIKFYKV